VKSIKIGNLLFLQALPGRPLARHEPARSRAKTCEWSVAMSFLIGKIIVLIAFVRPTGGS